MDPTEVVTGAAVAAKDFIALGGVGLGLIFVGVFAAGFYVKGLNRKEPDDGPKAEDHSVTHRDIYDRLNDIDGRLNWLEGRESLRQDAPENSRRKPPTRRS